MKTKILSILLTVAMLVAMVPMIAVSAEETSVKTVTVNSPEDIFSFLSSADNVEGNIMKLGADIHYENCSITPDKVVEGYWSLGSDGKTTASTRLKASVDGNGHTVYIPGGTYQYGAILCYIGQASTYTFKNLKVVMASEDAVASHTEMISLFGEHNTLIAENLTFENCYFDVNFEVTGTNVNSAAAVLLSRQRKPGDVEMTVKNCYFKMNAKVKAGAHGALLGRRWSTDGTVITFNVENSVFDVSYDTTGAAEGSNISCTALIGNFTDDKLSGTTVSTLNATGNLICNGLPATNVEVSTGFTTIAAGENPVTTVTGYQTTTVANDKFDLRLVGLVELGDTALTDYSKVGFVVVANYANINTKWTSAASNKVYSSLSGTETDNTANGGTGIVSYEASDFGADYLYALAIKNIPANQGVITLEVTPYYIAADGTTVVYGATENVEIDPATLADNTLANG